MHKIQKLHFNFFKILDFEPDSNLRVSLWLEENSNYLMPCEFKEILKKENLYIVKVKVLDPDKLMSEEHLEKKFFFGHPGKIIAYGIFKKIAP